MDNMYYMIQSLDSADIRLLSRFLTLYCLHAMKILLLGFLLNFIINRLKATFINLPVSTMQRQE